MKYTILKNDASWSHHPIIRWFLLQWLSRRCPLQPPEFRRLGWSSPSPEPLSSPAFVLKTILQNTECLDTLTKRSLSVALSHVLQWMPFPLLYINFQWVAVFQCLFLRGSTRPSTWIVLQIHGIQLPLEDILLSSPAVSRLQPNCFFYTFCRHAMIFHTS